jgi:hypothetical protein
MEKYIPKSKANTDNAWVEYYVVNYHQDGTKLLYGYPLDVSFIFSFLTKLNFEYG